MNINWQEIKEKYPNAFKLFVDFMGYTKQKYFNGWNDWVKFNLELRCYCDLEKFFDDNGIYIEIYINPIDKKTWNVSIDKYDIFLISIRSRQEAKEQAIIKGFEILEQQLKRGEK